MDTFGLMVLFMFPFAVAAFTIWLLIAVFFLLNLRDALREVAPQNRAMEPNQVWLNLIPLFNLVWIFVTVIKVRDSLRAEYAGRGWARQGDFGLAVGLAAAISSVLWHSPLFIVSVVCWVIYWVRMSEIKSQLVTYRGYTPKPTEVVGKAAAGAEQEVAGAEQEVAGGTECPSCGTPYHEGASFCWKCGRPAS